MNSELQAFENSLLQLTPADALDRDTLMFRAGQVAATRSLRCWRMAASLAACLAIGIFAFNVARPRTEDTKVVERVVYVQREDSTQKMRPPIREPRRQSSSETTIAVRRSTEFAQRPAELSEFAYLNVRKQVLEKGLDALPRGRSGTTESKDIRQMIEELGRGCDLKG